MINYLILLPKYGLWAEGMRAIEIKNKLEEKIKALEKEKTVLLG